MYDIQYSNLNRRELKIEKPRHCKVDYFPIRRQLNQQPVGQVNTR